MATAAPKKQQQNVPILNRVFSGLAESLGKRLSDATPAPAPVHPELKTQKGLADAVRANNAKPLGGSAGSRKQFIQDMTDSYDKHKAPLRLASSAMGQNPDELDRHMEALKKLPDQGEVLTGKELKEGPESEKYGHLDDDQVFRKAQPDQNDWAQMSPDEIKMADLQKGEDILKGAPGVGDEVDTDKIYAPGNDPGSWQAVERGTPEAEGAIDPNKLYQKDPQATTPGGWMQSDARTGADLAADPVHGENFKNLDPQAIMRPAETGDMVQLSPTEMGDLQEGLGAASVGGDIAPVVGTFIDANNDMKKERAKNSQETEAKKAAHLAKEGDGAKSSMMNSGEDTLGKAKDAKIVAENMGAAAATELEIAALDAAFGAGEVVRAIPGASKVIRKGNKIVIGFLLTCLVVGPLLMASMFIGTLGFIVVASNMVEKYATTPLFQNLVVLSQNRMTTDADYRQTALARVETLIAENRAPKDISSLVNTVRADEGGTEDEYRRISSVLVGNYLGMDTAYAVTADENPTKTTAAYHYLDGKTYQAEVTSFTGSSGLMAQLDQWPLVRQAVNLFVASPDFEKYYNEQQKSEVAHLLGVIDVAFADTTAAAGAQDYTQAVQAVGDPLNKDAAKKALASGNYQVSEGNITTAENQPIVDALNALVDLLGGVDFMGIGNLVTNFRNLNVAIEVYTALSACKSGDCEMSTHQAMYDSIQGPDATADASPSPFDSMMKAIGLGGLLPAHAADTGKYNSIFSGGLGQAAGEMMNLYNSNGQTQEWQTDFIVGNGALACEQIKKEGKMNLYYQTHCDNLAYREMLYSYEEPSTVEKTVSCTGGMIGNSVFDDKVASWINASAIDTGTYAPLIAAIITIENAGAAKWDSDCIKRTSTAKGLMQLLDPVSWEPVKDRVAGSSLWSGGKTGFPEVCANEDNIFGGGYFLADRLQTCASCMADGQPCTDPKTGEPYCTADEVLPNDAPSDAQLYYMGYRYYGDCSEAHYIDEKCDAAGNCSCMSGKCNAAKKISYCDSIVYFAGVYGDTAKGFTAPSCKAEEVFSGGGSGGAGAGGVGTAGPDLMKNVWMVLEDPKVGDTWTEWATGYNPDGFDLTVCFGYPSSDWVSGYTGDESHRYAMVNGKKIDASDCAQCTDYVLKSYQNTNDKFAKNPWSRGAGIMKTELDAQGKYSDNGKTIPQEGDIAHMGYVNTKGQGELYVGHAAIICKVSSDSVTICQYNSRESYDMEYNSSTKIIGPDPYDFPLDPNPIYMIGWSRP